MWWDDVIVFIPISVDILLVVVDWLAATTEGGIFFHKVPIITH